MSDSSVLSLALGTPFEFPKTASLTFNKASRLPQPRHKHSDSFDKPVSLCQEYVCRQQSFIAPLAMVSVEATLFSRQPVKSTESINDILQQLEYSDSVNKSVSLFQKSVSRQQSYMVEHIKTLLAMSDDDDEKIDFSVGSLNSMLLFLIKLGNFRKPTSIELNENGTFQLRWKQDDSHLVTLRFQKNNRVDYVMFLPSKHEKRPIVLNGNINLFDFEDFFINHCDFTTRLLREENYGKRI